MVKEHFYASALINEGVDAAAVLVALGHSVISTTTFIYCHVFQQAQAGDAIASADAATVLAIQAVIPLIRKR